jgi:hypothetical protein
VLISPHGGVRLADFGLARAVPPAAAGVALTPRQVVTAGYRAPELLLGEARYGAGVDTWALGCIAYELFAGRPLFLVTSQAAAEDEHGLAAAIFDLCGEPGGALRALPGCCPGRKCLTARGGYSALPLRNRLERMHADQRELITQLLALDPAARASASDVVTHRWLSQHSTPPPCAPHEMPRCSPEPAHTAAWRAMPSPAGASRPLLNLKQLADAQPDPAAAAVLRSAYCDHISALTRYLQRDGRLSPHAYANAVVFTHRYYAARPLADLHAALLIADAAVLLAAKTTCGQDVAARTLSRVVNASFHLRQGVLVAALTPEHRVDDAAQHEQLRALVLRAEACLAHDLKLRLHETHAGDLLRGAAARLAEPQVLPPLVNAVALLQAAEQLAEDALRTQLPLVVAPGVMAAACLLLAAAELPDDTARASALGKLDEPNTLVYLLADEDFEVDLGRNFDLARALRQQLRHEVDAVAPAAAEARRGTPLRSLMAMHTPPCCAGPEPTWRLDFGNACTPPWMSPALSPERRQARSPPAEPSHRRSRDLGASQSEELEAGELRPPRRRRHEH